MSIAAILASPFARTDDPAAPQHGGHPVLGGCELIPLPVQTALGEVACYRYPGPQEAFVLLRRGWTHLRAPQQIPFRAQALALQALGVEAALLTTTALVLDERLPLLTPLLVGDLLMPENRLPDGSACTLGTSPLPPPAPTATAADLISSALGEQLSRLGDAIGVEPCPPAVLAYAPGPRLPTRVEERAWSLLGAELLSSTLGPDLVLANELGVTCAALAVGTRYARALVEAGEDARGPDEQRQLARQALEALLVVFLSQGRPPA